MVLFPFYQSFVYPPTTEYVSLELTPSIDAFHFCNPVQTIIYTIMFNSYFWLPFVNVLLSFTVQAQYPSYSMGWLVEVQLPKLRVVPYRNNCLQRIK